MTGRSRSTPGADPAAGPPTTGGPENAAADGPAGELSPREIRRQFKISIAREHILNATERVFGDLGYQGTSVEQIAAASEFSVGAIYTFFDSKQALLAAVMERRSQDFLELMDRVVSDDAATGMDQLLTWVDGVVGIYHRHPGFGRLQSRVHSTVLEANPDFAAFRASLQEGLDVMLGAIGRGQSDGSVRTGDPRWLAQLITGLIVSHHGLGDDTDDGFPRDDLATVVRAVLRPVDGATAP